MDYLTFGLLAGSLTVIASFVLREGGPYLSSIGETSRLARLRRRGSREAWARWCSDAGLALAAAGTLVILVTVAALLSEVRDEVGAALVAASVVVAAIGSALVLVRLTPRYRGDVEPPAVARETPSQEPARVSRRRDVVQPSEATTDAPVDERDDDLPIWSPRTAPVPDRSAPDLVEVAVVDEPAPRRAARRDAADAEPDARSRRGTSTPADVPAPFPPRTPPAVPDMEPSSLGGVFASPLLAGIGPSTLDEEVSDEFRSPLLTNLDRPIDAVDLTGGADLLIDESPSPGQPSPRPRDEIQSR